MKKRLLFFLIFIYGIVSVEAMGDQDYEMFSLTSDERYVGWEVRPDFGIKYMRPNFFSTNKTKIAFREDISGKTNKRSIIYKRLDCIFFTDYLLDDFSDYVINTKPRGMKSAKLFESMVKGKAPIVYSVTVVRSRRFRKKYVEKITGMKFNYIVGADKTYTHIFSTTDVDMSRFTEKEKSIFYDIVSQLKALRSSIQTCHPGTVEEALKKLETLSFYSVSLSDKPITDDFLKKAQVTMIYYWDSSEPLCRIRLKQISTLDKKYPNYRLSQLGIVANITDEDNSDLEKTLGYLDKIGCKFTNLKNSSDFSVFSRYLLKPSLLFFVDKNGNILTPIITKHLTDRQLEAVIKKALTQAKK